MSRLVKIAVLAAAAAAVAHYIYDRDEAVPASAERVISGDAARKRLRDVIQSVRGA